MSETYACLCLHGVCWRRIQRLPWVKKIAPMGPCTNTDSTSSYMRYILFILQWKHYLRPDFFGRCFNFGLEGDCGDENLVAYIRFIYFPDADILDFIIRFV